MKNKLLKSLGVVFLLSFIIASSAQAASLGINGNRFTIDGQPTFLVIASYFDALDAETLTQDLDYLRSNGVNGIRIFPNWGENTIEPTFDNTLMDANGNLRPEFLASYRRVIQEADNRGMIVDITFTRDTVAGLSVENYKRALITAIQALGNAPNVFYDWGNERNGAPGSTYLSEADIIDIRNRVDSQISWNVYQSASEANEQSASGHIDFVNRTGMDIFNLHESRNQNWPNNVFGVVQTLAADGSRPAYLGEPERWPEASVADLEKALADTIRAGGAAWTFHNEGSFFLNDRSFRSSLSGEEQTFLSRISGILSGTTWPPGGGGGPLPPPGGGGTGTPTALYCAEWRTAQTATCGCYIGGGPNRPEGTKQQVVKAAMNAVLPAWENSTDINGYKMAVVAYLNANGEAAARGNNGNCNQSQNNLAIRTGVVNGIAMAEMYEIARDGAGCRDETGGNYTVGSATPCRPLNPYVGSWDFVGLGNRPVSCSTACTAVSTPVNPPQIYGFDPMTATPGEMITVTGSNLTSNIQLIFPDGSILNIAGAVNSSGTVVTFNLPNNLQPGEYGIGNTGPGGAVIANQKLTVISNNATVDFPLNIPVPLTEMNFGQFLQFLINYSLYIVGLAVFIMVFWAGFTWFTAMGNAGAASAARSKITNAVIGAILLVGAYVILNTINPDLVGGSFEVLGLRSPAGTGPGAGGGTLPPGATCQDHQSLARAYNAAYPERNAPELDILINCLLQDSTVANLTDRNQLYTYERTNPACNYTHGDSVCGLCQHARNSCHYGGSSGNQGSLAVDFNASNQANEQQLYNAVRTRAPACGITDPAKVRFETNHTHVSTNSCDGN